MPLVQLVTDLKSLKYGKDTPGGGYSGQPYIQAKIPDGLEPKSPDFILRGGYLTVGDSLTDIKRLTKMFFDLKSPNGLFFIAKQNVLSNSAVRTQTSGVLNEGIYTPLNTLAEAGVIAFGGHLNKQGINPFAQTGAYAVGDGLYNSVVKPSQPLAENRLVSLFEAIDKNEAIRNWNFSGVNLNVGDNDILSYRGGPGSTLGVGTTNIRFADKRTGKNNAQLKNIGFFNPSGAFLTASPAAGDYKVFIRPSYRTKDLFINPYGVSNAYESATGQLLPQGPNGSGSISIDGGYTFNPSFYYNVYNPGSLTPYDPVVNSQKILKSVNINDKQVGGLQVEPFKPWTWNGQNFLPNFDLNKPQSSSFAESNTGQVEGENVYTYNKTLIKNSNVNPPSGNHLSPKTQDFRAVLRNSLRSSQRTQANQTGATPKSLSYNIAENKTIEYRVNLGDPGARSGKDYSSYTKGIIYSGPVKALDTINALPVYTSYGEGPKTGPEVNDLITFRIGTISNLSPDIVDYIHFRAFLDSFTDTYTGDWSGYNYLGRGEKFYTYNGFDRKISLSFNAAAQSKQELIPMYKKLNFLASNLAPDYSGNGYMKGCFITLTVGGYLYEQPGFITNLSYDMITEMPWEIGINDTNGNQDPSVKQLSHMVKINSFDFTPIHNFIPSKMDLGPGTNNQDPLIGDQQYIALANPNNGRTNWNATNVETSPSVNRFF